MKKPLLLLSALWLLSGCATGRPEVSLTSEPSIERALDLLNSTSDGRQLVRFMIKNPVTFEYSNTPGLCHKFSMKRGKIFLPLEYKNADQVMALAVARAAYIYRLYVESGMDEIISEEEELGALFQARLGVELGVTSADFAKAPAAAGLKNSFCNYILENSGVAMELARKEALSSDTACQRPLDTMETQRVWLEKTRQAINDETFYQLLYERDMARVKKGAMPMSEAMKNDANLRAMPTYEVYRFQRSFYDKQSDIFTRFAAVYGSGVREDGAWRAAHGAEIDRAREEFSDCNMP